MLTEEVVNQFIEGAMPNWYTDELLVQDLKRLVLVLARIGKVNQNRLREIIDANIGDN